MNSFSQRAMPMQSRPQGKSLGLRLLIGLGMAAFSLISYFSSSSVNTVTGEKQYIKISAQQEIAMGLQAAPQMAQQYGGLTRDANADALVKRVCAKLAALPQVREAGYPLEFHVLADERTVNAFALPGGQTFITMALLRRLQTEGQIAGVMGHEIGHVLARHGAERMAKQQLTQGLSGAAVLATYDPSDPKTMGTSQVAMMIGNLVTMKFGREDELESDYLGVRFMAEAGYDPRAMIRVMEVLAEAGGGGQRQPEFFSTHPNPDNRIGKIKAAIDKLYPNGVPADLLP
ncbi:MAG: M48 family metallopeptidase [Candidatus Kapabacteria bacterium]|jgi:predicted Zn-dependent protease|nr:M48 family metallopeptidase [Candidatus Kapabacteria bacterium]